MGPLTALAALPAIPAASAKPWLLLLPQPWNPPRRLVSEGRRIVAVTGLASIGSRVYAAAAAGDEQSYPAPKRAKQRETSPQLEVEEIEEEELESFLELDLQSSYDSPPRHYEVVFLVHEASEESIAEILEKLKAKIADDRGTIWRLNDWGLRPLAYKIKKARNAHYFLLNVELPADKVSGLNTFFLSDERIIRHLMTKKAAAETKDYPAPILYNAREEEGGEEDELDDEEEEFDDDEFDDGDGDDEEDKDKEEDEDKELEDKSALNKRSGSSREKSDAVRTRSR